MVVVGLAGVLVLFLLKSSPLGCRLQRCKRRMIEADNGRTWVVFFEPEALRFLFMVGEWLQILRKTSSSTFYIRLKIQIINLHKFRWKIIYSKKNLPIFSEWLVQRGVNCDGPNGQIYPKFCISGAGK